MDYSNSMNTITSKYFLILKSATFFEISVVSFMVCRYIYINVHTEKKINRDIASVNVRVLTTYTYELRGNVSYNFMNVHAIY